MPHSTLTAASWHACIFSYFQHSRCFRHACLHIPGRYRYLYLNTTDEQDKDHPSNFCKPHTCEWVDPHIDLTELERREEQREEGRSPHATKARKKRAKMSQRPRQDRRGRRCRAAGRERSPCTRHDPRVAYFCEISMENSLLSKYSMFPRGGKKAIVAVLTPKESISPFTDYSGQDTTRAPQQPNKEKQIQKNGTKIRNRTRLHPTWQ